MDNKSTAPFSGNAARKTENKHGHYSEQFLEDINCKIHISDLIDPPLKKTGEGYHGLCPFHKDTEPSFSVSRDNLFNCHACGAKGNLFHFIEKRQNLTFLEAVKFAAHRAGVPLPKAKEGEKVKREYFKYFKYSLTQLISIYSGSLDDISFQRIQTYFNSRHIPITREMAQTLSIKVDHSSRSLWMPCKDANGQVVRSWWRKLSPEFTKIPGEKGKLYNHGISSKEERQNPTEKTKPELLPPNAIVIRGDSKRFAIFEGIEDALTYYYLKGQSTGETILACCSAGNFPKMAEFCKDAVSVTVHLDGDLPKGETVYPCFTSPSVQFAIKLARILPDHVTCDLLLPARAKDDINKAHCEHRGKEWLDTLQSVKVEEVQDYTLQLVAQLDCADRFVEQYQGRYCLDVRNDSWMVLENNWRKDDLGVVPFEVGKFVRSISNANQLDDKQLKEVRKQSFANAVQSAVSVDLSMRRLQWDTDQMLIGTPGATINLNNGSRQLARASDYITKQTLVEPKDGTPRLWLQFLQEVTRNDADTIHYLHKLIGYMLTGDIREHALIFIYGEGGNGKSVFANILLKIFGDYALMASMGAFMEDKFGSGAGRASPELMRLEGARLVVCNEIEEGQSWAEAKVKALTGGDPITGRHLYQEEHTYTPTFKIMVIGNYKPNLKNVDNAMRRRLHLIPFLFKPENPNKHLEESLLNEAPQILQWGIEGCKLYLAEGLDKPKAVKEATDEYFEEQDTVKQWLESACELSPLLGATPTQLCESYSSFVGEKQSTHKMKNILKRLESEGRIKFIPSKKINGKVCKWWAGIGVISENRKERFNDDTDDFNALLSEVETPTPWRTATESTPEQIAFPHKTSRPFGDNDLDD